MPTITITRENGDLELMTRKLSEFKKRGLIVNKEKSKCNKHRRKQPHSDIAMVRRSTRIMNKFLLE